MNAEINDLNNVITVVSVLSSRAFTCSAILLCN